MQRPEILQLPKNVSLAMNTKRPYKTNSIMLKFRAFIWILVNSNIMSESHIK